MTWQLPDPCHVKREDAAAIAREVFALVELWGSLHLYFDAAGAMCVSARVLDTQDPFALVGVYDHDEATLTQITEDILASQREPLHG